MTIHKIKAEPNTNAIEVLERALEKAKNGELLAVSLAWVTEDNSVGGDFSSGPNVFLMWASIEHAARSYYTDIVLEG